MKKLFILILTTISLSCFCQRTIEFTAMKYGLDSIEQKTVIIFGVETITIVADTRTEVLCTEDFDVNEFIVPVKGTRQFMKHFIVISPKRSSFELRNSRTFYRILECCGPNQ